MKKLELLTVTVLMLLISGLAFSMPAEDLSSDTIRVKTEEGAQMIIIINTFEDIKGLDKEVSAVLKSLDKAYEKFDDMDSIINVSVNRIERKIVIDGTKAGEFAKIDVDIDAPRIERKPQNLHGYMLFSLGFNNYLDNGKFPNDNKMQHSVKAWGSWDVAIGGGMRWYMARSISLDLEASVSWYNFKFQDRATRLEEHEDGITFVKDTMGYEYSKSKLTAPYLNAEIIPMVHFGKGTRGLNRNMFRLGAGVYGGYRIGGHVKYVFEDNSTRSVYKDKGDFFMNSYRYGVKFVFGVDEVNLYASYDLSTLFAEGQTPELNPISFGVNWKF